MVLNYVSEIFILSLKILFKKIFLQLIVKSISQILLLDAILMVFPLYISHFTLKVTEMERDKAEDIFGGLGFAASLLLPKYRLSSLLNSPR